MRWLIVPRLVKWPGSQRGQSEHPRPEFERRTIAPLTMIVQSITTVTNAATRYARSISCLLFPALTGPACLPSLTLGRTIESSVPTRSARLATVPLRPIDDPSAFAATRSTWHALAEHVLARARWEAT